MRHLRWSVVIVVGLAALSAVLTAGLLRGAAYGRYVAAQALVERRWSTLDGLVNGVRPQGGAALDGVAYAFGHYYLTEPPLLTWLATPFYALGIVVGSAPLGSGWTATAVALLGPVLLLATLFGVARLAAQVEIDDPLVAGIVLATAIGLSLVTSSAGTSWLLAAALTSWLMVGIAWRGRVGALAHGLLAGATIASHPWLTPAVLVALVAARRQRGWRVVGLAPTLALVGLWQWQVFGRPWRFASQFALEPLSLTSFIGSSLFVVFVVAVGAVLLRHEWQRWWPLVVVGLLVVGGLMLSGEGAAWGRAAGLAGVFGLALALVTRGVGRVAPAWRWPALLAAGVGMTVATNMGTVGAPALLLPFTAWQRGLSAVVLTAIAVLVLTARRRQALGLATSVGVGAAAMVGLVLSPPVVAAASQSLIPAFSAPASDGGPNLLLWRLAGGAVVADGRLRLPTSYATADSPIVGVRPGERYCAAAGPSPGEMILVWEDDGKHVLAQHGGGGAQAHLCFAAPVGATGVRLRLVGAAQAAEVTQAALWAEGARVAPLPDYAVAALSFTFDWESAMGGLIHSKGGSGAFDGEGAGQAREEGGDPLAIAEERGGRMRQGAETLAAIFRPYDIRGTFYSTGYNLLDGNPDRRTFAGDPTYRWANRANGWGSNYWTVHRWYGDDPYTAEQEAPDWYFGSVTRRLAAEGHEIQSHTFGHLYVRGASPDELERDTHEWNAAAEALGLPAARSFAFPWRSSNSVKEPHLSRLTAAGITSLTRVYALRPGYEFELDEAADMPGLTIFPDTLVPSTEAGGRVARRTIDEVVLRRGVQSLWTHPEEVVDPAQVAVWTAVVEHAALARAAGLWVAPLVEIVDRIRAGRDLEVVTLREPGEEHLWLTNQGTSTVTGAVVELGSDGQATHDGAIWPDQREQRVRAAALAAGEGMTWTIVAGTGQP